jgi:hypothetical protein
VSLRTKIYREIITREYAFSTASTNNRKFVRWCLQIVPAEDAVLGTDEVTRPDLPSGAVLEFSEGDAKFENGIFLGLPETEERTLRLDWRKIPADLRDWITTESGVSVTVGDESFWLSSVWILSCDNGDPDLDLDLWETKFMGCHLHTATAEFDFEGKGGAITMEVKLQHIGKIVLESLSLDDLRVQMLDTDPVTRTPYRNLYTLLLDPPGGNLWGVANTGLWDRVASAHEYAWLMSLEDLFEALRTIADTRFRQYMRLDGDGWMSAGVRYVDRVPFEDTVELFRQSFKVDRSAGTALTISDLRFIGLVSPHLSPTDQSASSREWIGGLLIDAPESQSFYDGDSGKNCWNLLQELAENACCKVFMTAAFHPGIPPPIPAARLDIEPTFLTDSGGGYLDGAGSIAPGDLLPHWKWTPQKYDIRSCEVPIIDAGESDVQTVTYSDGTNRNAPPYTLKMHLHTQPMILDAGGWIQNWIEANYEGEFSSYKYIWSNVGYDCRVLYYEDQPSFATQTIAIRVWSGAVVHYGRENVAGGADRAFAVNPVGLDDYPSTPDVSALQGMLIEEQRYRTWARANAQVISFLFSKWAGTNFNGTGVLSGTMIHVPMASFVGRWLRLVDFDEATTGADLWENRTYGVVTSARPNDIAGTVEVEIVTLTDFMFYVAP